MGIIRDLFHLKLRDLLQNTASDEIFAWLRNAEQKVRYSASLNGHVSCSSWHRSWTALKSAKYRTPRRCIVLVHLSTSGKLLDLTTSMAQCPVLCMVL